MDSKHYVLITPARNEAAFIDLTIESVIGQTITPLRWIIVSDGSTDGMDERVRRYTSDHNWIELIRMPERAERHFAGKVYAFNAGYERVRRLPFHYVGSLDADTSFDPDYFEFLIDKFALDTRLGLIGTPFLEENETYDYRFVSVEHVSGACQFFRRECFHDIGGYRAVTSGGIDHIAVLTARMKGWKTRTFTEKNLKHHRPQGSATRRPLKSKFHVGRQDYALGGHPVWEIFRAVYQMTKRPLVLGGLVIFAGYFSAMIRKAERSVPDDLVRFRRSEQMRRLAKFLRHIPSLRRPGLPTDHLESRSGCKSRL